MDLFFARQPILDRRMRVFAYELLYRPGNQGHAGEIDNPDVASSQVIVNSFIEMGIDRVTGGVPALVNVTKEFVLSGALPTQYQSTLIPELLEDIQVDEALVKHMSELVSKGGRIALDDFVYSEQWRPLLDIAHIIKLDVMALGVDGVKEQLKLIGPTEAKLLAEKVETHEEFETYREMGFDYFQGYFFAKPKLVQTKGIPTAKHVILQLLGAVNNPAATMDEVVQLISQDPRLSFKILRVVNSAAAGLPRKIESIRQGVIMVGFQEIRTFASLLALSQGDTKPIGLLITAIVRGKMCQFLAEKLQIANADSYFTVGLFSLLDALIDVSLDDAFAEIHLAEEVTSAVLHQEGKMGAVLKAVIAYEVGDWDQIKLDSLTRIKPTVDDFNDAYVRAIEWAELTQSKMGGADSD